MNKLADCWKRLYENREKADQLATIGDLAEFFSSKIAANDPPKKPRQYTEIERLWRALKGVPGWGEKTAALFVKSLIEIHCFQENDDLHFLCDFQVPRDARPCVPVDAVIRHIFTQHLADEECSTFTQINQVLQKSSSSYQDLVIWDDLWFWGFITQRVRNNVRRTEINMPKFWSLRHAPYGEAENVETAANKFVSILTQSH
jgi:hypothetical protein